MTKSGTLRPGSAARDNRYHDSGAIEAIVQRKKKERKKVQGSPDVNSDSPAQIDYASASLCSFLRVTSRTRNGNMRFPVIGLAFREVTRCVIFSAAVKKRQVHGDSFTSYSLSFWYLPFRCLGD